MSAWTVRHKYCSRECANAAPRSDETRNRQRIAKLGKPSWNKGKHLSEHHRNALRGPRHKIVDTSRMMGRRPWNKIGDGITPLNERIRKSPQYRRWRSMVYNRDNYTCVLCGARNGMGHKVYLHADHILPFSLYPEKRFEVSNGRTLCVPCHQKTESYGINQHTHPSLVRNKTAKNTNAA